MRRRGMQMAEEDCSRFQEPIAMSIDRVDGFIIRDGHVIRLDTHKWSILLMCCVYRYKAFCLPALEQEPPVRQPCQPRAGNIPQR